MKIGTKLAVLFVAMAVLPLGVSSIVSLRATSEFGQEMADRGKALLADRLTRDLRRVTENGAISFSEETDRLHADVKFIAAEIAAGLDGQRPHPDSDDPVSRFLLDGTAPAGATDAVDLERTGVKMTRDAERDRVATTLANLNGLTDVFRSIYLGNRGVMSDIRTALESGFTLVYPAGIETAAPDPREQDWYVSTLEKGNERSYLLSEGGQVRIDPGERE